LRCWLRGGFDWRFLFRFGIVVCLVIATAVGVVVDGGEGAEEQAAYVGENGGASGRYASLSEEIVKSAEGVIDALRVLEICGLTGKRLAKVNVAGLG
jgi:hypothetical protein